MMGRLHIGPSTHSLIMFPIAFVVILLMFLQNPGIVRGIACLILLGLILLACWGEPGSGLS